MKSIQKKEFTLKIDWSKNQLSKKEMKQVLGGDGTKPCHNPVTNDPFSCKP